MALLRLIFVAIMLGLSSGIAQQSLVTSLAREDFSDHSHEHSNEGIDVRFVPPVVQGTVSLGIFDSSGKLVRTLCEEWTFNRFRVGLNGLSTAWDGKNDAGERVPAGMYAARGFIVGDVDVAGVAFYFNDWIETEDSPRIVHVAAQQILNNGDILLAARLAGNAGALVRYSPQSEARWHTVVTKNLTEKIPQIQMAISDALAFILLDESLQAVSLEDGKVVPLALGDAPVSAIAADAKRLALFGEGALRIYNLSDFSSADAPKDVPGEIVSLALLDSGLLAALKDGSVWRWADKKWTKQDLPNQVVNVASGPQGTFWVLESRGENDFCIAQYSFEDGRLAEWAPKKEDGTPAKLAASNVQDFFSITLLKPEIERTVGIRRNSDGKGWEFALDKKIVRSEDFGWKDGKLVAVAGELPTNYEVGLVENMLDPSLPRSLKVRAVAGKTGTGLATEDGLFLLGVSDSSAFKRVLLVGGDKPDTLRFFQGDGACVEEYEISNIGDIIAFDAGEITMDAAGEAPSPPVVEPPDDIPPAQDSLMHND